MSKLIRTESGIYTSTLTSSGSQRIEPLSRRDLDLERLVKICELLVYTWSSEADFVEEQEPDKANTLNRCKRQLMEALQDDTNSNDESSEEVQRTGS